MNTKTKVLRPSTQKNPRVRTGNVLRFDNNLGARYGSFDSPISGGLEIDTTGAKEFGLVAVVWSGGSDPLITGHDQINVSGRIDSPGTHTVYLHWIDGQVNVSFFTPETPDALSPSTLTLLQTEPSPEVSVVTDSEPPSVLSLVSTFPTVAPDSNPPGQLALLQTTP